MKYVFPKGSTSVIVPVFIQDSSSTTGAGLGSLDQTSGIVGGYLRPGATGVALAVDQDVTTEGTYQAPSTVAQVRIGTPANMRTGTYELHLHNDLLASGADAVFITLGGATNMADLVIEIQLTSVNLNDGVSGGMTALPSAAADAGGGLPISDVGGLDLDAKLANTNEVTAARMGALTDWINGGRLDLILDVVAADVVNLDGAAMRGTDSAALASVCTVARLSELDAATGGKMANQVDVVEADTDAILVDTGTTLPALLPSALVGGKMDSDVTAISGSAAAADNLEASAKVIVTGAAIAGTLSTTQMTTNLTEATDDHYNGRVIIWTSGVLLGQATDITDYTGSTKLLTYTAITESPSAADTFVIV